MQPIEQLSYILPTFSFVVDRIEPMQLHDPTPCAEFTVHDVLDHMIVQAGALTYRFRGETPPDIKAPAVYGIVPAAQFRAAMDDLLAAAKAPGAMERTIPARAGALPGATVARFVALDGLVHSWDLATATGVPYALPECLIEAVDEFARTAITPAMRDGDTFKEPTAAPEHAERLERLAAFTGRTL